jgi:hypothetical protein
VPISLEDEIPLSAPFQAKEDCPGLLGPPRAIRDDNGNLYCSSESSCRLFRMRDSIPDQAVRDP